MANERNMNDIRVSILVPIYKVEKFIGRCAESLFGQTYPNIEYIFVNDCTPDGSIEILNEILSHYPERQKDVRIINNETNQGIEQTRNTLIGAATGDYIQFVDSDDWIENDAIEVLVASVKLNNSDLVGINCYGEFEGNIHKPYKENFGETPEENFKRQLTYQIGSPLWHLFIRRSLFTDNNIRFTPGVNIGEDYIVCLKLYFYAKSFIYISDRYLYHYTQFNQNCYSVLREQNIIDHAKAIKEIEYFCRDKGIYGKYKEDIDKRKFAIKRYYILDKSFFDPRKWRETFPESDYTWKKVFITKKDRLIYFLAYLRLDFILKLIVKWSCR